MKRFMKQAMKQGMKREHAAESITSGTTALSSPAAPAAHGVPGRITVNFHSAEFNHPDDLSDCSGNYRSFQPLDGIVTADMRRQTERRRADVDSSEAEAAPLKKTEPETDGATGVEAAPPLTVISQGRTLIIDTDAERAVACSKLLGERGLICTLLVTKNDFSGTSFSRHGRPVLFKADAVSIAGAFGCFSATTTVKGDQQPLTERFGDEAAIFDLVLDLQATPSYAGGSPPMGYYAPGPNPANLPEALAELPEMRGQFKKPQFTAFLENRCFHGRSRTGECRQCLAVCPVGAIQSVDKKITINHYLCQGCGGCTLVCPADAVRMVQPSLEERIAELRRALENRPAGGAFSPALIVSDADGADHYELRGRGDGNDDRRIHFEVEQIGCVGLEMLLTALVCGAGRVVVASGPQNPPAIKKAVAGQTQMARAVLEGLGMRPDKILFVDGPSENKGDGEAVFPPEAFDLLPAVSPMPKASFSAGHDRRALIRLTMQHLYDQSGVQEPSLPLPAGSPFGAVNIAPDACTLCMACAVACPSGALSAGGDAPRLEFIESRCHQCGLCGEACPEGALHLLPRMLCDLRAVETSAVLHEVEPFRCVECGEPFASQTMINRMREKLAGHWMYAGDRQLRRLLMCRTCRARDALTSRDMNVWSLK